MSNTGLASSRLSGRAALVTGGSRGIGRAVVRRLAADGAASKAAVEQFVRVVSRELGTRGITANVVSPGPTDTDLLRAGTSAEIRAGVAAMTALGRIGRPADIADLVAFLAGPDNGWVTGQNICVDGGLA